MAGSAAAESGAVAVESRDGAGRAVAPMAMPMAMPMAVPLATQEARRRHQADGHEG